MIWTSRTTKWFCWAAILLLLGHISLVFFQDSSGTSLLKRGDFPAFYSAAMILRQGLGHQLYDTQLLRYVQNLYWPNLHGGYISFPYPPYAGFLLAPLAWFPPGAAKAVHVSLMTGFLALAFAVRSARAPVLRNPLGAAAFCLGFFPISFGLLGGQTTALSLLLYAAALHYFSEENKISDWLTGFFLGLWLFKPQYGFFMIALLLAARNFRAMAGALTAAVLYYGMAVFAAGWGWPLVWIKAALRDAALDFPFNSFNMISTAGFLNALAKAFQSSPALIGLLNGIGILFSAGLTLLLGRIFFQSAAISNPGIRRDKQRFLLELAGPVMLLASPHALFYDLGICAIACARHLDLSSGKKIARLLAVVFLGSAAAAFKSFLPVSPLILVPAGCIFFLLKCEGRLRQSSL